MMLRAVGCLTCPLEFDHAFAKFYERTQSLFARHEFCSFDQLLLGYISKLGFHVLDGSAGSGNGQLLMNRLVRVDRNHIANQSGDGWANGAPIGSLPVVVMLAQSLQQAALPVIDDVD